jgi:hypothetical protein
VSRAPSASVIGEAGGSEDACRVDPAAALREATERNAREAREEREAAARLEAAAAAAARAEAEAAAKAREEGAAKAQAEADVKAAEDLARSVVPESTDPQQSGPPTVEDLVPTRRPRSGRGPTPSSRGRRWLGARRMLASGEAAIPKGRRGLWPAPGWR